MGRQKADVKTFEGAQEHVDRGDAKAEKKTMVFDKEDAYNAEGEQEDGRVAGGKQDRNDEAESKAGAVEAVKEPKPAKKFADKREKEETEHELKKNQVQADLIAEKMSEEFGGEEVNEKAEEEKKAEEDKRAEQNERAEETEEDQEVHDEHRHRDKRHNPRKEIQADLIAKKMAEEDEEEENKK